MRGNKKKGTRPEVVVRKILSRLGLRYRLHADSLPGKPDIVFGQQRIALFVHGCFWHQHAAATCRLRSMPRSNADYWQAKLRRNVERDTVARAALGRLGWKVFTVWECETRRLDNLQRRLSRLLRNAIE
jgi:DNA mismatch endonuclease, patch repair protein